MTHQHTKINNFQNITFILSSENECLTDKIVCFVGIDHKPATCRFVWIHLRMEPHQHNVTKHPLYILYFINSSPPLLMVL